MEGLLGTDYIDIIVEAGPSTNFLAEVRKTGKYALMLCNWGPDYADPETYSDPWSLGYTYSWPEKTTQADLLTGYTYTAEDMSKGVFDEDKFIGTPEIVYIKMVQEGKDEKLDIEKRYTSFANAEAFLINHAIVIPSTARPATAMWSPSCPSSTGPSPPSAWPTIAMRAPICWMLPLVWTNTMPRWPSGRPLARPLWPPPPPSKTPFPEARSREGPASRGLPALYLVR